MSFPTMEFKPISKVLGAEVSGIDLTQPITAAIRDELKAGLLKHEVLFFREQKIQPEHHRALAMAFGEVQPHPAYPTIPGYPELTILENDEKNPPKIDTWHTDMTFMERPPLGSILHGVVTPEAGGDTMFASLNAAYNALSSSMKKYVEGLKAEHSFSYGFRHSLREAGGYERLSDAIKDNPPVLHPVIRTHPESGKKCLFVNRLFTTRLVDVPEQEGDAILKFLFDHLETPEFSVRFKWRPNSIAFWDNRATLHRPVNDYYPAHRRLQRITIRGDRPA